MTDVPVLLNNKVEALKIEVHTAVVVIVHVPIYRSYRAVHDCTQIVYGLMCLVKYHTSATSARRASLLLILLYHTAEFCIQKSATRTFKAESYTQKASCAQISI